MRDSTCYLSTKLNGANAEFLKTFCHSPAIIQIVFFLYWNKILENLSNCFRAFDGNAAKKILFTEILKSIEVKTLESQFSHSCKAITKVEHFSIFLSPIF